MQRMVISLSFVIALVSASVLGLAQETDPGLNAQGAEWKVYYADNPDPRFPRVLLIGDSVMNGYREEVCRLLTGKANVDAWVNPYYQASPGLEAAIREVLAGRRYEVIHFNMGLHGWPNGRIPNGQFEPLMRAYVGKLKKASRGAELIWATTTPVTLKGQPGSIDPIINATIVSQNELSEKVVREAGVPVDDLYAIGFAHLDLAKGDQFHWTVEAYQLMAISVADSILAMLQRSQPAEQ